MGYTELYYRQLDTLIDSCMKSNNIKGFLFWLKMKQSTYGEN